jgi:hypothetical protein
MSKSSRSTKLFRSNIKNDFDKKFDHLYQWDFSRKIKDKNNKQNIFIKSSFISIVQKGNKFYIDKPYYIYSGKHTYRLLNNKISFFIKIYHFNYKINEFVKNTKNYISKNIYNLLFKVKKLIKNLFKSKEEKEFEKWFK